MPRRKKNALKSQENLGDLSLGGKRFRSGKGVGKLRKFLKFENPANHSKGGKPQQRNAANARERARMRVLSRAFSRLKTTLPWVPADTKLSKLDTLRLASSYIAHLKRELGQEPLTAGPLANDPKTTYPRVSMTWPFGFNRSIGISSEKKTGSEASNDSCTWPEEDHEDPEDFDELQDPQTQACLHLDLQNPQELQINHQNQQFYHQQQQQHHQQQDYYEQNFVENILSIG